jgi:hypothetical protein
LGLQGASLEDFDDDPSFVSYTHLMLPEPENEIRRRPLFKAEIENQVKRYICSYIHISIQLKCAFFPVKGMTTLVMWHLRIANARKAGS